MAIIKSLKECIFCKKQVYKLAARGLCANCYYREKRNGTPDYVKVRKPCVVEGCDGLSVAHGHCAKHYRRLVRSGVAEHERFDRWGHASTHPLSGTYYWISRAHAAQMPKEWRDDFWAFTRDVGDRPTSRHKLHRKDKTKPYSTDNVEWVAPKMEATMVELGGRNGYARARRATDPKAHQRYFLRQAYGIGLDEYEALLEAQNGLCALCKKPEAYTNPKTGTPRNLAVDHCHDSKVVRGLLCSSCNTGLGSFKDDIALMRRAIRYLAKHRE